jgi:aspartate-semialdehyde dehydrogenase
MKHVAIIGATGVVGREVVRLLLERGFPCHTLSCFASERSAGKTVHSVPVQVLHDRAFETVDLAFFCAGSGISRQYIPLALRSGAHVIDSSSAYRTDPHIPLCIPELNGDLIHHHRLIASPNCVASILLMILAPLHQLFRAKRVILTTYQAASGGGATLMQRLYDETRTFLHGALPSPSPYAFNLFLHDSRLHEDLYVEEERKIQFEVCKILQDESIRVSATCVRVPVLRAHSLSANVEFHQLPNLAQAQIALQAMPGVCYWHDRFPTPHDATGKPDVFCGRLRIDRSHSHALEFWAVGDQLLKGAALNAVQIAEKIMS